MGKFTVSMRTNGEYQFVLKAVNGQIILNSEGYSSKAACLNGIQSVSTNSQEEGRFELKTASNGKLYFNLKAANGQVIGTSQMYDNEAGRSNGIESVKSNAGDVEIEDTTT